MPGKLRSWENYFPKNSRGGWVQPGNPDDPLEQRHRNLAASLQARLEEVYLGMLKKLAQRTGLKAVCLAGGVAFNCVANGKIFDRTPFEQVFVQPAAGDAGLAVGAAYYVWHQKLGKPRSFVMEHSYWGPEFSHEDIAFRHQRAVIWQTTGTAVEELHDEVLNKRAAAVVMSGKILGWFQGRAEWGPRALGNRSIVADPRRPDMKEILNQRIKHREIFRPFAPSILADATGEWFEKSHPSPFMTMAYAVRPNKREQIPAPDSRRRHRSTANGHARRQSALLARSSRPSNKPPACPMVLNTSFNDNEPIVCRPEEALDCFLRTQMDALVLGDFLITKK